MSSPLWEPLEALAKEFVKHGKLRPVVDVRDGVVVKITVSMGEGVERAWTLEDVKKAKAALAY